MPIFLANRSCLLKCFRMRNKESNKLNTHGSIKSEIFEFADDKIMQLENAEVFEISF